MYVLNQIKKNEFIEYISFSMGFIEFPWEITQKIRILCFIVYNVVLIS